MIDRGGYINVVLNPGASDNSTADRGGKIGKKLYNV